MPEMEIFNPVATSVQNHVDPAPRVDDLDGKRIGLYWNMKGGGDIALSRVEKTLGQRYPNATFAHYEGTVGFIMRHVTAEDADKISADCDVIIGTSSD